LSRKIKLKNFHIGGGEPLVLIAGPCIIEDKEKTEHLALRLKEITNKYNIPFIFKASYDKANRTSLSSFRGPGLKTGLSILKEIKRKYDILVLSDVHNIHEIEPASSVLDVIQIPAFLCRQTDLIIEASKSRKVVNIKKGQFMAPSDMQNVIKKFTSTGNENLLLIKGNHLVEKGNLCYLLPGLQPQLE
jgi:2-dehydro-3-deoxyphosphooctonate aldolase (KDO 8-P synthase)